jgi:hypothetical protein
VRVRKISPQAGGQPEANDTESGLANDAEVDLRLSEPPFLENNRRFFDSQATSKCAPSHFNLE